jgi:ribose transport system substrate-binding protein
LQIFPLRTAVKNLSGNFASKITMKRLNFLVSLITTDNDYQQEQARAAEEAARKLNVGLQIIYAESDAINQSQQLLKAIQAPVGSRPDGIIFEAVSGIALPQVARAALSAGIGWVVLNCDADYLKELRGGHRAPVFAITSDHEEIGRIQGHQFRALLPKGGTVLYIQGPSQSLAAVQRTIGMSQTKPENVDVRMIRGRWTEISANQAISAWLRLSTSRKAQIDVVACQNDAMAAGARKAFEELTTGSERKRWLSLPYTGCDGVPNTGQAWVQRGLLAATVVVPASTAPAIKMLAQAIQSGSQPPERTLTALSSYPALDALVPKPAEAKGALALSR